MQGILYIIMPIAVTSENPHVNLHFQQNFVHNFLCTMPVAQSRLRIHMSICTFSKILCTIFCTHFSVHTFLCTLFCAHFSVHIKKVSRNFKETPSRLGRHSRAESRPKADNSASKNKRANENYCILNSLMEIFILNYLM